MLLVPALSGCFGVQLSPQEREALADRVADLVMERLEQRERALALQQRELPADPYADERQVVKIEDAPGRGAPNPLVTVVVFSDFECPFCQRVVPTLENLLEAHPGKLRLLFRHNPLPMHARARAAATAAIEAYRQAGDDAFWSMHDRLFAMPRDLAEETLLDHGRALGLSVSRLQRALQASAHDDIIERDQAYARALAANGTPTFFINGRELRGAQPFEAFDAMVRQELEYAEQLMAAGVTVAELYPVLMGGPGAVAPDADGGSLGRGGSEAEAQAAPAELPEVPDEPEVYDLPLPDEAPSLGPSDAAVTIQIFSDFECPFCQRVLPTLERLRGEHPEVRFVYRNYPLPFHPHAALAHEAAWEVFVQRGSEKFWAYHDLLFENRRALERDELERYASEIGGISMRRLRRALSDRTHRERVEADIEAVREAGARIGTPAFFINGRLLQGAQPYHRFRDLLQAVQEEVEGADSGAGAAEAE